MKVDVLKHQEKQISSLDKIKKVLEAKKALGFDISMDNQTMGFAMVRENQNNKYFLWVYAIDKKFQGQGIQFIELLFFMFNIMKFQIRRYSIKRRRNYVQKFKSRNGARRFDE